MPKSRRSRGRFVAVPIFASLPTLTTASNGSVKVNVLDNVEDVYWTSADLTMSYRNATPGQGPIGFGVANNDLNVTEINEAIAAAPVGPDDIIQIERARRPVRTWGSFQVALADEVVNNGNVKRYRVKMAIGENSSLAIWAQNRSGAILTTGGEVIIAGKIYGFWR